MECPKNLQIDIQHIDQQPCLGEVAHRGEAALGLPDRDFNVPCQVSAPEPSRTSPGVCTETGICTGNLARNLVLKLHRVAPELIWAKDRIAKFCVWGKIPKKLQRIFESE